LQAPFEQVWPAAHAWPQAPQLWGSLERFAHTPLQSTVPAAHTAASVPVVQTPFTHVSPAAQSLLDEQTAASCPLSGAGPASSAWPVQTPLMHVCPAAQSALDEHVELASVELVHTLLLQVSPALHVPQLNVPPQPSAIDPHVAPDAAQVVGTQASEGPASSPVWHTPLTHVWPAAQSLFDAHEGPASCPLSGAGPASRPVWPEQTALTQTSPAGQSAFELHDAIALGSWMPPKLVKPLTWTVASPFAYVPWIWRAVPSFSTASTATRALGTPAGMLIGMVRETGTEKTVPLGSKSIACPIPVAPGAYVATLMVDTPMLMFVATARALGGMVMLVPAMEGSSLALIEIVAPAGPTEAVLTNLLPTFCGPLLHASAATARPTKHPTVFRALREIMIVSQ
jgi:hypothetical protein